MATTLSPTCKIPTHVHNQSLSEAEDVYTPSPLPSPDTDPCQTFNIQTTNNPSVLKLLSNETFCGRIIVFLITTFLSFLSLLYTIGQNLCLHLANYWCTQYPLEDIRQHSIDNNLPHGDTSSECWESNRGLSV